MDERLYSVDQVAELLGLHVRTVRGYVRDGRLPAVRIGRQYRITATDLAAFTGGPVPAPARESAARHRRVEVSSTVRIDAISQATTDRLTTLLLAAAAGAPEPGGRAHVQAVHDEERASLTIIIVGDAATTAALLGLVDTLLANES